MSISNNETLSMSHYKISELHITDSLSICTSNLVAIITILPTIILSLTAKKLNVQTSCCNITGEVWTYCRDPCGFRADCFSSYYWPTELFLALKHLPLKAIVIRSLVKIVRQDGNSCIDRQLHVALLHMIAKGVGAVIPKRVFKNSTLLAPPLKLHICMDSHLKDIYSKKASKIILKRTPFHRKKSEWAAVKTSL